MSSKLKQAIRVGVVGHRHFRLRDWLIVAGVGLAVFTVAVVLWSNGVFDKQQAATAPKTIQKTVAEQKVDAAVNGTQLNPDYATAAKELDKQLQSNTDKKQEADIYAQKAAIAYQQGNYQAEIDNYTKAIQLDSSRTGPLSESIAKAYEKLGNTGQALTYYRQAHDFYVSRPKDYSGKQYLVNSTQAKITELGG